MNAIYKLLLFFVMMLAFTAQAQDTILVMTLKDALKQGTDSSRSLKISNAKLLLAEAKYNQAVDAALPSVRLAAGYTRLSDIEEPKFLFPGASEPVALFPVYVNNYAASVSVSETVFSGFRLKYAKESQRLLKEAARLDNESDKNQNAFLIARAYFNLFKLLASEKVIKQNHAQLAERIRETEAAARNGLATKNDVLRWKIQMSNLDLSEIDIRNNIDIAEYNFKLMLGIENNVTIVPDSNDVFAGVDAKTFPDYLSIAMEKRNDLAAAELRSKTSYNVLKVAQNSYLPRVAVNGEFLDARPNPRYIPPVDEFRSTWSAGVSLTWDLVSLYSNRHNVDEARSLYLQSTETHSMISDVVKTEIHTDYISLTEAIQKAEVMKTNVEQAAENYRLTNSLYKNSLVVLSDLLDADSRYLSSQINYLYAKADIQIAYYSLLKSAGTLK